MGPAQAGSVQLASVQQQAATKVAAKTLNVAEQQGQAAVKMLEGAADLAERLAQNADQPVDALLPGRVVDVHA